MRVVLHYELLRDSVAAWRDAVVMTTGDSLAPRDTNNLAELERVLSAAIQKVEGCLAVLMICEVDEADAQKFNSLLDGCRAFRAWLEQGLTAARMMGAAPQVPSSGRL